MLPAVEYCPICQSLQQMNITIDQSEDVDSEGNSRTIVTKNYQCINCYQTVRREYLEAVEELDNNEETGNEKQQKEDKSCVDGK